MLIAHNTIIAGLKKRVDGILKKGCELLEASSLLRKEKVELEEKLLNRLLELQKALERCQIFMRGYIPPSWRSFHFESRSTWAVPRSWRLNVSFEPSGVAWRVVIMWWRS